MRRHTTKIMTMLLLTGMLLSLFSVFAYSSNSEPLSAKSAALYDPQRRSFIIQKNENARLGMASTTKIMTALIALEELPLTLQIEATESCVGVEGSSIYLKAGEILLAEDLIYALMLSSANDAATVLATKISGSVESFAAKMNEYAESLGLSDTHFSNPHGLDSNNHYTTAHDLAIITAKALENPKFVEIVSSKRKTIESSETKRTLVNHNKLLSSYEGCMGVKTGYTKKTGRSLVSAAMRDGYKLIAVTIDAPNDWRDHKTMLDYGFSKFKMITLANQGDFCYRIPVIGGKKTEIFIKNAEGFKCVIERGDDNIKSHIELDRYLIAPIKQNETVGQIIFYNGDKEIGRIPLLATEEIDKAKRKWLFRKQK